MSKILLLLLLCVIKAQDDYERLISENVTEEYCNNVISNLTAILNETYVYTDFLKGPIQQEGFQVYDGQIDILGDLNNIEKKNRTFYEFYRDILKTLSKTKDGHLFLMTRTTPKNFSLILSAFCIPFYYYVEENETQPYLSINFSSSSNCYLRYSNETLDKIRKVSGKKIKSINGLEPYEYIENMASIFNSVHSPQGNYIAFMNLMSSIIVYAYPFKKEELNLSFVFEDNDSLEIQYEFIHIDQLNLEFINFYYEEIKYNFKHNFRIPTYEEIELKYKIKKGLVSKEKLADDNWDLEDDDGSFKCKIDEENKVNVFYHKSFPFYYPGSPLDRCFMNFYSNNYPIIVIEDYNTGGAVDFAVVLTKYIQPRINKPYITSRKATNTILEHFFKSGQFINSETCIPYNEKDNILDGKQEIYSNGVIHHRTKNIDSSNIIIKKQIEQMGMYLAQNIRKPTEIIVFTDGYSFSCGSAFIKRLQRYGSAIIVGYNTRLNNQTKFDASQSNSWVGSFGFQKNMKNLENLRYDLKIAYSEEFNPNNKNENEVPEEFLIYPVDEISKIYKPYRDEIYDRFIKEAKDIIEKYNKIDGECNPDNKYLYFESNECDNIIEKGHGGYLCGTDGKWNTSNCIISYCDEGYILNDNRTQCIKDPCGNIQLKSININDENYTQYIIEPNTIYIFTIRNVNNTYSFSSETEGIIYKYNYVDYFFKDNNSIFGPKDLIIINYYLNVTENTTLYIKKIGNKGNNTDNNETNDDEFRNFNPIQKKKSFPAWKIVLIILGVIIALLIFVMTFLLSMKNNQQVIFLKKDESIDRMRT